MSMFEWPEPMLQAVIAEGMVSGWKEALELPTAAARNKAKQKILNRVTKDYEEGLGDRSQAMLIARLYVEAGPILAEHRAISKAAEKMPMIRNAAPEILTPDEGVELMKHETLAPQEEWARFLRHKLHVGEEMYLLNDLRVAYKD